MGKQHRNNNIPARRAILKWQPFNFCIICNTPLEVGEMCGSCADFILQKQKEEKALKNKKYKRFNRKNKRD